MDEFLRILFSALSPDFRSLNLAAQNFRGQGVGIPQGPPPNPHAGMVALGNSARTPLAQETLAQTALNNGLAITSTPGSQAAGSTFSPGRAVTRPEMVSQIQDMNRVQRPLGRAGQAPYDVYQTTTSLTGLPVYNRAPMGGENVLSYTDARAGQMFNAPPPLFKQGLPGNVSITPFTPPNPNRRGGGASTPSRPVNDRVVK